jgi:5'-3' exonuclease
VYRPTNQTLVDLVSAETILGYPPEVHCKVTALTGESKDNIPGAGDLDENGIMTKIGLGPKTAFKILEDYDFHLKKVVNKYKGKFQENILKNKKQILMSYKLSKLRIKKKMYSEKELSRLRKMNRHIKATHTVSEDDLIKAKEYLQFRTLDMPVVMKKLGVNVIKSKNINKKPIKSGKRMLKVTKGY